MVKGAWVAQLVKRLTSAQVMISWFMGLSSTSGSGLTARSLEPASNSVSPSLSLALLLTLCLSLSKTNKNIKKTFKKVTDNEKQIIQLKMGSKHEKTYFQRRHSDANRHEKMLNITHHQGNATQNYNEMSPHTYQNG